MVVDMERSGGTLVCKILKWEALPAKVLRPSVSNRPSTTTILQNTEADVACERSEHGAHKGTESVAVR
jgi:hypothetical protein